MPESVVQAIIKHKENNRKGKVASAFCGLQTSTRNRSVTVKEIGCILTVWIED
jgi:hypothetical protein